ncbi:MAG: hypothetical protein AB7O74_09920 [Candidatus Nanopelagicales bacterium]
MAAPTRLVGVYRAEGSLRGELAYVVGKLLGTAHCALCDITHSPVRRKAAWDRMVQRLGVPFDLVHLDERDPPTAALVTGWDDSPAVLAEIGGALVRVLGPDELEAAGADVERFEHALRESLDRVGAPLPDPAR